MTNKEKKQEKCIEQRLFHEWTVSEWKFWNRERENNFTEGIYPHYKVASELFCKFCLKTKFLND